MPAVMSTAPPPADDELVVDGETVWVTSPVDASPPPPPPTPAALPAVAAPPVGPELQGLDAQIATEPIVPELPAVQMGPCVAVLVEVGDSMMLVLPPLFELLADGATVMVLPLTVPDPLAEDLLIEVASPPSVELCVELVAVEVAAPLPDPDPVPAFAVAPPPVAVPFVVVVAPPCAKAGAAKRTTTSPALARPIAADARDVRKN